MEYLLMFVIGGWVALFSIGLAVLVVNLIMMAFAIPAGAVFGRITYLGFVIEKDLYAEDPAKRGKLTIQRYKFSLVPDVLIDCYWPEEKGKVVNRKVNAVTIAVFAAIVALLIWGVIACPNNYIRAAFIGLLIVFGGMFLGMLFLIPLSGKKKNDFLSYLSMKIREIRDGGSIENVDLPPLHELPVQTGVEFYKWRYLRLRHLKAELANDLSGIAENIAMIERLNDKKMPVMGKVARNAILMDYYSFRQKDVTRATGYYNQVKDLIENDMDFNGRRTLGYYSYFVLRDKEKARKCVEQGLSALAVEDPMYMKIEREYEEKMLLYLKRVLEEDQANGNW